MRKTLSILAAAGVMAGAASQVSTAATPPGELPSPGSFAGRVDNPWFPLLPGTVSVYRGVKDGKPARDVFTVTRASKVIAGIPAKPHVGQTGRQEYFKDHAEDQSRFSASPRT